MDEARRFEKVENLLGHSFKSKKLLRLALIHSSCRKRDTEGNFLSNERLEFLGDSILGFAVTELIYRKYPDVDEGQLTRIKSSLVSRRTLAILIREFKIQNSMEVGKSIPKKVPDSVMANLFEALVGALYLDGGMRRVQNWINVVLSPRLTMVEKNRHMQNHKSILQQFSQKMWSEPPLYKDTGSTGPDHDQVFKVTVSLLDGSLAEGEGGNKKMAEQKAAMLVLRALKRKNAYKEILKKISG